MGWKQLKVYFKAEMFLLFHPKGAVRVELFLIVFTIAVGDRIRDYVSMFMVFESVIRVLK